LSAAIEAYLDELLVRLDPALVGFCWPMRGEFDLLPLMTRRAQSGARAALPVVVAPDAPLAWRAWRPGAETSRDRYGIPFPTRGESVVPDLVVVPLVGFDAAGFRLGYGGGYFDRTMAAMRPRPVAVGVGFETGRIETIDPRQHDVALDWLVTETGIHAPAGRKPQARNKR
jgi:5,10-methenyltetrahydrofolate synthetase